MTGLLRSAFLGALTFGVAGSAVAADLPSRAAPVAVAPVVVPPQPFNWTGFYGGLHVGGAYDRYTFPVYAGIENVGGVAFRSTIHAGGPIGGGQIGYNFRTPFNVLLGVEADISGASIRGSVAPVGFAGTVLGGAVVSTRVDALASVRFRVGYVFDRLLFINDVMPYFTAGAAFGAIRDNYFGFAGSSFAFSNRSHFEAGASGRVGTVGIGVEKAITNNLSIDFQYRYQYMRAGTHYVPLAPTGQGQFGTRAMYHIGRVGLNYHFNMGGSPQPVVARY